MYFKERIQNFCEKRQRFSWEHIHSPKKAWVQYKYHLSEHRVKKKNMITNTMSLYLSGLYKIISYNCPVEKHYSSTTQVVFLLKITTYLKGRKNVNFNNKNNNLSCVSINPVGSFLFILI